MTLRHLLAAAALGFILTDIMAPSALAEPPVYTGAFSDVAVQGHDPVAYFREGRPVKGSKHITTIWNGATFRFATAGNRTAFLAAPESYVPQYGGHCAWAAAQGKHAKGDARHWRVVDGKLYLNYDAGVQRIWEGDIPGFIAAADKKWPEINK